jgi:hypothetical protein
MFLQVYDVSMACRSASVGIGQLLVVVPITKVPFNLALGLAIITLSHGDSTVMRVSEGAHVNSTLKIQKSEATLIEQIKAEIKKRSEAKAKRMLLRRSKRLTKLWITARARGSSSSGHERGFHMIRPSFLTGHTTMTGRSANRDALLVRASPK